MRRLLLLVCLLQVGQAQTLTVFAASSLTESFTQLVEVFASSHPTAALRLNFGGSAVLAAQIEQGAPADVFASADLETLLRVVTAEQVLPFTSSNLVVIVAQDSAIASLQDLTRPHLLVLATASVPIGNYARQALGQLESLYGAGYKTAVLSNLVSEETNVRQAAAKVELGEADATFVYATDLAQLQNVRVLDLPAGLELQAGYYAAAISNAELATQFLAFLRSDEAQTILKSYGFGTVPTVVNVPSY